MDLGYMPPGQAPQPAPGIVDATGMVMSGVPCRRCSYDLRGLNVAARCPECGAPVGVAVHGPLLRYSDPEWVAGLARGTAFVFWGILLGFLVSFTAGVFLRNYFGPRVSAIVGAMGGLVYLYGVWLMTEPDPSGIGEDQYGRARRIIRFTTIVGIVQNVLAVAEPDVQHSRALTIAFGVASLAAGLIGVAGQFAELRYLQLLARRISDEKLSRRARFLFWAFGGSLAVVMVLGSAAGIGGFVLARPGVARSVPRGIIGVLAAFGILTGVAVIAMLVFGLMYLLLLRRLKRAFRQQAEYARLLWANVATPARAQGV
jgi:hypothetical protein